MEIKNVDSIAPEEMYTARLELRSVGEGMHIQPYITFSHTFPDDYAGEYPGSFIAMRDIAMMLALQTKTHYIDSDIPSDPDELARVAIGVAESADRPKN